MYTKPLTRQSLPVRDDIHDLSVLRRLLVAAAISAGFCAKLLEAPVPAVYEGFGGESFSLSDSTLDMLASIHETSLPEFIQQLDARLSNRLLSN